jgi:hypothetical protein
MTINITAILVALIAIAILCVIAKVVLVLIAPADPKVSVIVWAIVTILCLLVLLGALTGHSIVTFSRVSGVPPGMLT